MPEPTTEVRRHGRGFSIIPHSLTRDKTLSSQARFLYVLYASFTDYRDPQANPSEKYVCDLMGIGAKPLRKYRWELVQAGWIEIERERDGKGCYGKVVIHLYDEPISVIKSSTGRKSPCGPQGENPPVDNRPVDTYSVEEPLTPIKEHTPPTPSESPEPEKERVCVSSCGDKDLTQDQETVIEITVRTAKDSGRLKNEGAYRASLVKAAMEGNLDMSALEKSRAKTNTMNGGPEWLKDLKIRGTRFKITKGKLG